MKILVTGGAGLVGSHTAEYYAQRGEEVIVLDNLIRSNLFGYNKDSVEYNWRFLARYKNIKRIKGDVRKKGDVLKAIGSGVDVVIHTAGQPGVALSIREPRRDFEINALGTLNLLECLRRKSPGAVFIYCSTNKVYGENVDGISLCERETRYIYRNKRGVSEEMPIDLTGHTPYGVSKYTGDIYTQEYAYTYGMRTAVFRMSCIYGTRQFGFEDQGWVAWFAIATLFDRTITIYGDGKQVRDILYVTDLIDGYDRFIQSKLNYAVFNIGGGIQNAISLLEFLKLLKEETGKETKVIFSNWRLSDQKVYISDISNIKNKLGWHPKIDIKKGVRRLISWVRNNKRLFM